MSQFWTISSLTTGAVLCPCFETPGPTHHPEDHGWSWDADSQKATCIDTVPDVALTHWDGSVWAPDLPALRSRRWSAVKAARARAEAAGCATALGQVDTDPDSQRKVSGSVQLAMIAQTAGAPFAIDWTMQDNSVVEHDAAQMIAMGVAVGWHIAACHAAALAKRAAIGAAATREAIEAVELDSGWPE